MTALAVIAIARLFTGHPGVAVFALVVMLFTA